MQIWYILHRSYPLASLGCLPQSRHGGMITLMLIGLISDTHIPSAGKELSPQVAQAFGGVDLILHAGDLVVLSVLDWLGGIAPVLAAQGNEDGGLMGDARLKPAHILTLGGLRVGLVHELLLDLPLRQSLDVEVDVIVHGHTHEASLERRDGILLVNPGSPTYPRNRVDLPGNLALLEIRKGRARARILSLPR